MRIAITGYPYWDSLAKNLEVTTTRMGHDARLIDDLPWTHYGNPIGRVAGQLLSGYSRFEAYRSSRLARQVIACRPDLFISVWAWIHPEAVKEIRDAGIKAVLVFPDHLSNLGRQHILLSPYNLMFFKDPYLVRALREKAGLPAHYLPEACNPMWHKPVQLSHAELCKYQCDITTASNMYPYRVRLLEALDDGYDLKLWGPSWPRWIHSPIRRHYMGTSVWELEKAKAFNAARIVVNTMHYSEIEGVNCRTFEVAGCGAFQITDWKPALEELLEPDKQVVTFSSREELKEKVDYYLRHPEERRRIAEAGRERAHRDHTYEIRIRKILEMLDSVAAR